MTIKKHITTFLTATMFLASLSFVGAQYYTNTTAAPVYTNNVLINPNVIVPFPTNYAFVTASQIGMTSQEIANLQAYLATNIAIYPQRLVTGYFGPLTQAAVIRFQNLYGLSPVGYLDASTLAKLNLLVSQGLLPVGGTGGPVVTTAFTMEMSLGMSGQQVSQLQAFLATNPSIYPQGLVTGYFGALTRAAVMRFQSFYGIPAVGRVGPLTLAQLNLLIAQGSLPGGATGSVSDVVAPAINNLTVSASANIATVTWSNNEIATGKVFYSSFPLQAQEQSAPSVLPIISGTAVDSTATNLYSHSVLLSNLTPNTVYYFIVMAVDQSGNVTVTLMNTFKTTF